MSRHKLKHKKQHIVLEWTHIKDTYDAVSDIGDILFRPNSILKCTCLTVVKEEENLNLLYWLLISVPIYCTLTPNMTFMEL